jgi:ABC-type dipeptide/oligopeptide/nickel transport system permease subunit
MLSDGKTYLQTAPHLTIFPGLAILVTVLAFNFLGDGLRDLLDPRLKDKAWNRG